MGKLQEKWENGQGNTANPGKYTRNVFGITPQLSLKPHHPHFSCILDTKCQEMKIYRLFRKLIILVSSGACICIECNAANEVMSHTTSLGRNAWKDVLPSVFLHFTLGIFPYFPHFSWKKSPFFLCDFPFFPIFPEKNPIFPHFSCILHAKCQKVQNT